MGNIPSALPASDEEDDQSVYSRDNNPSREDQPPSGNPSSTTVPHPTSRPGLGMPSQDPSGTAAWGTQDRSQPSPPPTTTNLRYRSNRSRNSIDQSQTTEQSDSLNIRSTESNHDQTDGDHLVSMTLSSSITAQSSSRRHHGQEEGQVTADNPATDLTQSDMLDYEFYRRCHSSIGQALRPSALFGSGASSSSTAFSARRSHMTQGLSEQASELFAPPSFIQPRSTSDNSRLFSTAFAPPPPPPSNITSPWPDAPSFASSSSLSTQTPRLAHSGYQTSRGIPEDEPGGSMGNHAIAAAGLASFLVGSGGGIPPRATLIGASTNQPPPPSGLEALVDTVRTQVRSSGISEDSPMLMIVTRGAPESAAAAPLPSVVSSQSDGDSEARDRRPRRSRRLNPSQSNRESGDLLNLASATDPDAQNASDTGGEGVSNTWLIYILSGMASRPPTQRADQLPVRSLGAAARQRQTRRHAVTLDPSNRPVTRSISREILASAGGPSSMRSESRPFANSGVPDQRAHVADAELQNTLVNALTSIFSSATVGRQLQEMAAASALAGVRRPEETRDDEEARPGQGGLGYEELMRLSEMLGPAVPRHAALTDVVDQLPTHKYQKMTSVGSLEDKLHYERCTICLEKFILDEELRSLPCHHFFHQGCIDQWLSAYNNNCPVCRTKGVEVTTPPPTLERPAPAGPQAPGVMYTFLI